jgi:hypothetical protein
VLILWDKKWIFLCGPISIIEWRLYGNRKNLVFCVAKIPFFPFFGKGMDFKGFLLKIWIFLIVYKEINPKQVNQSLLLDYKHITNCLLSIDRDYYNK